MTGDETTPVRLGGRRAATATPTRTQRLIWASQRRHGAVPLANMADRIRIRGAIDPERFVAAVDAAVRAAPIMRMTIDDDGETIAILATPPASTEVIDLAVADLDAWTDDRVATPIDATVCVYDSVLLRHADDDWTWWIDVHHVAIDAWGAARLAEAVAVAYAHAGPPAEADLTELLGDDLFARPVDDPDAIAERAAGWSTDAADAGPQAPLTLYGRRGPRTTEVDRLPVADRDLRGRLEQALAGSYRAFTPELALLALSAMTTATLVRRLDGRSSVVMGVPVHHRTGPHRNHALGPMMELYPLTVHVVDGETNAEMFSRVLRSIMAVLRRARPGESPDTPFEIVLNVTTARYDDFAGLPASREWIRSGHVEPNHVLRVQIFDQYDPAVGHELVWELDLNRNLSADGSHRRLPRHFAAALDAILTDPDAAVGAGSILTDDDRAELVGLNPEGTPRPAAEPVHVQVQERLLAAPEWVVAEMDGAELRAAEFDAGADRLARRLVADGLQPGRAVGLRMGRGPDVLVAIHGVLRAGGRFVFLDPADPDGRHAAIAEDAELFTILEQLPSGDAPDVELPAVGPDDGAYVLYTSGSTGLPKGVPISHRGLADYLRFAIESYLDPDEAPVVALHSSLVFDLTITSLFLGPLTGGRTIVYPDDPIDALAAIAAEPRITFCKATPSQLEILTKVAEGSLSFRSVVVGGEAFRRPVAERLRERCAGPVRIFNEYGPTEAVVGCMIHEYDPEVDTGTDVPIGTASPGAALVVLDHLGQVAPAGAWGELFVQRVGMADQYLNRPELSAERFRPLDSAIDTDVLGGAPADAVWYRTGDRVRLERPGVLVYGGRHDDQMKVNGIRLEPAEVEEALVALPEIDTALVRVWSPADRLDPTDIHRCIRCGLGLDVPGVTIDPEGVCSVCREFEIVEPQTREWFKNEHDLDAELTAARAASTGDYDCLHLLSGGKDSTYALYQLVERGWRVHALTLDNGYISEGAKDNVRRSIADLDITHEFVTTEAMDEIFRDSLDRYSNVCQGCYKTIYTLAVARADELGVPVIVTGLSRGQFFETRLVPHQFEAGRFDPAAIDATVLEARRVYHDTEDAVTTLLPEQAVFEGDVLDRISFVDFYRYVDVDLSELYDFLENRAPWVRPADTGRSTNCLINVAGISVHTSEQGYHNYAEPYAWDVRLGHKTRAEALEELDDQLDPAEVEALLGQVGYTPKTQGILTAWYQSVDGEAIEPDDIRRRLRDVLPSHAIPAAFVRVDEMPLAASAKADPSLLPMPTRQHRAGAGGPAPSTETEKRVAAIWGEVLGIESVGLVDDFFDLGGASLDALAVVALLDSAFGVDLPDAAVFRCRTVEELAALVDAAERVDAAELEIAALAGPAPIAPGEEAMLLEYRLDPADTRYNVNRLYTLVGGVDVEGLESAIRDVVAHHGPLHTVFDGGRTVLDRTAAVSFTRHAPMTPEEMDAFAEQRKTDPFDLDTGPLVRVDVAETGTDRLSVLIGIHHIGVDAVTFDVFWRQVAERAAGAELSVLPVTYAQHGELHRRRHAESSHSADFWRTRRAGRPPTQPLAFAADTNGPDGYLERPSSVRVADLHAMGHTPFAVALAAVAGVMATYTGGTQIPVGVTTSVNDRSDTADVIGYYLNTLPIDVAVAADASFGELVDRAAAEIADAIPHRSYPFAAITRDAREAGLAAPDVSVLLAYQRLEPCAYPGVEASHRILESGTSVGDITFFVQELGDEVSLGIEWRGDVVPAEFGPSMLDAFARVLEHGVAAPTTDIPALLDADRGTELVGDPLPEPTTVLARLAEQVEQRPDAPAVVDGHGRSLTYRALAGAAADAAEEIAVAAPGATRVGVSIRRSTDLVVAMLGAQLAGAAYVALDPTLPPARLARVAGHAALDLILTDDPDRSAVLGAPTLALDPNRAVVDDAGRFARMANDVAPARDAYVIFTSGSTGEPRGVAVTHANLAASTDARPVWYGESPERFLVTPSPGFDSSVVGLFWPLATGGTVILPTDDDVRDVDRLGALIEEQRVTHTLMVPSLWRVLIDRAGSHLGGLRTAIVAGEACPSSLVADHLDRLPGVALVNEYGPTEATVWATAHRLTGRHGAVPIGGPIPGTTVRVADPLGRIVPDGVAGELLIAGPGVTAGYPDDPAATAERFVELEGRRWYRTGDLVRLVDDTLRFVGRTDDQLNVGGVRVEPGEIERELDALPGVGGSVVVAAGEPVALVAHVEGNPSIDEIEMRRLLADRLPAASVPRRVIVQPALPRTANGKVDRAAASRLALPSANTMVEDDGDLDPLAATVLREWRRQLAPAPIGLDTDFFDAGGDSLAAVALVTAVGEALGIEVPIATLLSGPSPRAMVRALSGAGTDTEVRPVRFRRGDADGPVVVMTPSWDDLFGYQALAESFPLDVEAIVLAYEPPSMDDMITTVPELVDELETVFHRLEIGDRPTVILGWSIGGVAANELADRLRRSGARVDLLVLVDTFFPGEEQHLWSNRWWKYKSMARVGALPELFTEVRTFIRRRIVGPLRARIRPAPASSGTAPTRFVGSFPADAFGHRPAAAGVPTVLYRASTTNPARTIRRWVQVAPDLDDVVLPGRHRGFDSIMHPDKVGAISADIVDRLS